MARLLTSPLYRLLFSFVRNVYGIEVPRTVQVGRRLVIGHQSGIVVHPHAAIGDDCIIRFNSSLAGASAVHEQWAKEAPSLGDRVTIGAGAIVLGGVTIGNDVHIGPNAVVTVDVPSESVVVVDPPRILRWTSAPDGPSLDSTMPIVDLRAQPTPTEQPSARREA